MTATAADVVLCRKKKHYKTKTSARRAAALSRKQKGHAMFWYRCPVCGDYCLTGQPRRQSDITKAEKGQRAPIRQPTFTKPNIPHNERTPTMLTPTAEQADAIEVFNAELSMAVDALAGTGKSSTLRMIGESSPRRGQYVAFNKAVVEDARASFPNNVACQPPGTMVRVPRTGAPVVGYDEVPIESLSDGDRVVSWSMTGGGFLRKRGQSVTVATRDYFGDIVIVTAGDYESSYTENHHCVVWLNSAFEGKHIVYMMGRGDQYRIGRVRWRTHSSTRVALGGRVKDQRPDTLWILSVHDSIEDARIAERWAQQYYGIPGWLFEEHGERASDTLWQRLGTNRDRAAACLHEHNRMIQFPFWEKGQPLRLGNRWHVIRACNLIDGMRVPLADDAIGQRNNIRFSETKPITTRRTHYRGPVYSLDVAIDHTYIADGIITHNCSTAHSLAFRAVGRNYQHRLQQPRVRSYELAKHLGITKPIVIELGAGAKKVLQPGYLASHILRALKLFAFSADPVPTASHFEWIDGIDAAVTDGQRSRVSNDYVARTLMPSLMRAWEDWQDPTGTLPFTLDAYVKIWEQGTPIIPGDYVLIDEAQDLSPVMMSVIEQQADIQTTWVGDANQQLYEWRGSVDAMSIATVDARTKLSQSFRFGDVIAELANAILDRIPNSDPLLRVRGLGSIESTLAAVTRPDAILTRTNATAIRQVLIAQKDGRRPHLVGVGTEVAMFARAAGELMERRQTSYHDLACFDSWLEVQAYVEDDPQGSELALMTHLVDDFGVDTILNALDNMPPESDADLIVSTAHKSKGREWSSVQLTDDFAVEDEKPDVGELRLLYVAVTRAKHTLDVFDCEPLVALIS